MASNKQSNKGENTEINRILLVLRNKAKQTKKSGINKCAPKSRRALDYLKDAYCLKS